MELDWWIPDAGGVDAIYDFGNDDIGYRILDEWGLECGSGHGSEV
jgi:hypothetical protein